MSLVDSFFTSLILMSIFVLFVGAEIILSKLKDKINKEVYDNKPSIFIYILEFLIHIVVIFCLYILGWNTVLKFIPFVYVALMTHTLNVHLCILEESVKVYIIGLVMTLILFSF